jgi:hypothetical protein
VPQTGRSQGSHHFKFEENESGSRAIIKLLDEQQQIRMPAGINFAVGDQGCEAFSVPIPKESFVPRNAYKALCKMGIAALPAAELQNFGKLIGWLMNPVECEEFPFLEVGISVATRSAPDITLSLNLFRRLRSGAKGPYMLLVVTAGRLCWQLDLRSDHHDVPCKDRRFGALIVHVGAQQGTAQPFAFGPPTSFDWSSPQLHPIPIKALEWRYEATIDQFTSHVVWHDMHPTN